MIKVAAVLSPRPGESAAIADRMMQAQRVRQWQEPHIFTRDMAAAGYCCATPTAGSGAFFARQAENGSLLLVSGVPISTGPSVDGILADVCRCGRPELLAQLDGAFAGLFWNSATRRLTAVTDCLGLQPLYVSDDGEHLLLASELKAMAAAAGRVEMDIAGWGGFLSMGHCLGDFTTIDGVRRVPAASVVTWDAIGKKIEDRRYWSWPEARGGEAGIHTEDIVSSLEREMSEYTRYHWPGTVLLSGGFDSRLLLCLLRRMGHTPIALSVHHREERLDADGRFARIIAGKLGVLCRSYSAPNEFYNSSAYIDYLKAQEEVSSTLGLFIAQVSSALGPEVGAVWEGVAPGYALAFPRIRRPDLRLYLRRRCETAGSPVHRAARMVFRGGGEMQQDFERQLGAESKECSNGDSGLLRFEVRHQMRNRMGHNPLKVYSNDVACFTPGLSREFWALAASIPYAAKWNFDLYFEIFRRHFPEALEVPFCSMGQLWSDRFRADPYYHLARLFPPPGAPLAAKLLRSAGLAGGVPPIVRRVLAHLEPEHPDLRRDAVEKLKREGGRGEVARQARRLLFYWQIWRWTMEGQLDSMRPALVGEAGQ